MKRLRNQSGDTLIEVIFSLIILITVLVAALSLARQARGQNNNASTRTQAVNLIQEQYEALRSYRDSHTWLQFVGTDDVNTDSDANYGQRSGILRHRDSGYGYPRGGPLPPPPANFVPDLCLPNNGVEATQVCFHMERQSNLGLADYGQWVPCPGAWFPPLDYDSTWNQPLTAAQVSSNPYLAVFYNTYGCRGNFQTHSAQPIIQVGIVSGLAATGSCDIFHIAISANWQTTGVREGGGSQPTSYIHSYLSNVKEDSSVSRCNPW